MREEILSAKKDGDSVGGIIELTATLPAGLGSPVFGKLEADISSAIMGIGSVKGIEFGSGLFFGKGKGFREQRPIRDKKRQDRNKDQQRGGILGGISSGMPLVIRFAVKPTSSIAKKQKTINFAKMRPEEIEVKGRHDACIAPRVLPVAEAMLAIVLADHALFRQVFHPWLKQKLMQAPMW